MKVLFVCRANVGRSQMAKAIYNKYVDKEKAESAGTKVFEKEGQMIKDLGESAQLIISAMKEMDIDVLNERRKQITSEMVKEADKIVLMAERENIPDELFNNPKSVFWKIEDTLHQSYNEVCKTRDLIAKRVKSLLKE